MLEGPAELLPDRQRLAIRDGHVKRHVTVVEGEALSEEGQHDGGADGVDGHRNSPKRGLGLHGELKLEELLLLRCRGEVEGSGVGEHRIVRDAKSELAVTIEHLLQALKARRILSRAAADAAGGAAEGKDVDAEVIVVAEVVKVVVLAGQIVAHGVGDGHADLVIDILLHHVHNRIGAADARRCGDGNEHLCLQAGPLVRRLLQLLEGHVQVKARVGPDEGADEGVGVRRTDRGALAVAREVNENILRKGHRSLRLVVHAGHVEAVRHRVDIARHKALPLGKGEQLEVKAVGDARARPLAALVEDEPQSVLGGGPQLGLQDDVVLDRARAEPANHLAILAVIGVVAVAPAVAAVDGRAAEGGRGGLGGVVARREDHCDVARVEETALNRCPNLPPLVAAVDAGEVDGILRDNLLLLAEAGVVTGPESLLIVASRVVLEEVVGVVIVVGLDGVGEGGNRPIVVGARVDKTLQLLLGLNGELHQNRCAIARGVRWRARLRCCCVSHLNAVVSVGAEDRKDVLLSVILGGDGRGRDDGSRVGRYFAADPIEQIQIDRIRVVRGDGEAEGIVTRIFIVAIVEPNTHFVNLRASHLRVGIVADAVKAVEMHFAIGDDTSALDCHRQAQI